MFSGSLEKFEIHLDNPTATYEPGEVIQGQVIVDLNKTKSLRAVKLRFKGECEVSWSVSRRRKKRTVRTYYTGSEEYFNTYLCLFGDLDGETIELQSGHHIFPFSFDLPRNIPSSFDHDIGYIRYSIKAVFDRPWKFDHETTIVFTVDNSLILDAECYSMTGVDDDIESDYFCLLPCINRRFLTFRFEMPTTGYACGEPMEASINIHSKSASVEVTKLELALIQRLEFYSQSPYEKTYHETNVVQKTSETGTFPYKKDIVLALQVPSLPHSNFDHCGLIDVTYSVSITVDVSGCHCSHEEQYDILIGSRPPIRMTIQEDSNTGSSIETSLAPNAPPAPFAYPIPSSLSNENQMPPYPIPVASSGDFSYPSGDYQPVQLSPQIGFVYPNPVTTNASEELPPPSYENVMADNAKK